MAKYRKRKPITLTNQEYAAVKRLIDLEGIYWSSGYLQVSRTGLWNFFVQSPPAPIGSTTARRLRRSLLRNRVDIERIFSRADREKRMGRMPGYRAHTAEA